MQPNIFEVYPWLWQGAEPRIEEDLPKNITAIVNLRSMLARDVSLVSDYMSHYIWIPIPDDDFPGLSWLEHTVDLIKVLKKSDAVILIHCLAGVSRSAMLTGAVLMEENNWTVDKALNFLAEKNPHINPNRSFMHGLSLWQDLLRSGNR